MSIELNPDEDFHVVLNGNAVALSLNALDAAYQDDLVSDDTLIWQQGLSEWMRLDVLLSQLEQQHGAASEVHPVDADTYFVLVAEGEVKEMNLDLLADAYRLDVIGDETLVWQPGYTEWVPLSFLLGSAEEHVSIAPSLYPAPHVSAGRAPGAAQPVVDSVVPAAFSIPAPEAAVSPWYRRGVAALAVMGLLLVAHRNGFTHAAAATFEQETAVTALETRWGVGGIETAHGIERWLASTERRYGLAELSPTDPVPTVQASESEGARKPPNGSPPIGSAVASDEAASQDLGGSGDQSGEKVAKTERPDPTEKAEAPNSSAAGFAASLSGKPKSPPVRKGKKTYRPTKVKRTLPAGDPHDPMNGEL